MIRVRRWTPLAAAIGTCLTLPACQRDGSNGNTLKAEPSASSQPADNGLPPYPRAAMPMLAVSGGAKEPLIVAQAVVKFADKQMVPAQVDGYIELIAIQLPPGTKYDANDKRITYHPRDKDKTRIFRELKPGMSVKKGDVVVWLDATQIEAQYANSRKLIASTADGIKLAEKGVMQVDELVEKMKKANVAVSPSELTQMLIQKTRFEENLTQSQQTQIKAYQDFETAESQLRKHQPQAAVSGLITNVFKHHGEFAKAGEPILEIQSMDEVLIEGIVDPVFAGQVKPGMRVRIESSRPFPENRDLGSISHRREVSGIAVTTHPGRPLVVSGGMDGVAFVWEPFAKKLPHSLPHPVPVRAIAVTGPATSGSFLATGCDDGKVRIWNLSNPDKLPKADDVKGMEDGHAAAITAIAFSPNGKLVASAAGREVIIWDVTTGKKMYALPAEHKDAVTAMRFTPQCTLVTTCRDKAVRSWNLGTQGASLDRIIDHRAGVVDYLAVTSDGGRVLFDQDESRIDLVSLADGQSVGTIQGAGQTRFSSLALFSPDDGLVLTAAGGSSPGEMQLWEAPKARGRGFERVRLVTPGRTPVTCAAFSSDAEKKFVAVGTATGGIHLWTPPGEKDVKQLTGIVESVLSYNDKAAMVRVRVSNPPADVLQDRGTANIIIDPDAVAMMPSPSMTVPAIATPAPAPVTPAVATTPAPPTTVPTSSTVSPGVLPPIPAIPEPKKP